MSGGYRPHDDAWIAERGSAEQRVESAQQVGVAAPVLRESRAMVGDLGGREVGLHVRAAEGVDRLLRISDQHERGGAVEGETQDVPLHRVGVLELVDEHHPVAAAQPRLGCRTGRGVRERHLESGQQVVVPQDAAHPLAPIDLVAHGPREPEPDGGQAFVGTVRFGNQSCLTVLHHRACQILRVAQGHRRGRCAALSPLAQVEVLHHLGDEIVQVVHEFRPGVDIAGGAQSDEYLLAEPVRGHHRGGVERTQRPDQPIQPASRRRRHSPARDGAAVRRHLNARRLGRVGRRER